MTKVPCWQEDIGMNSTPPVQDHRQVITISARRSRQECAREYNLHAMENAGDLCMKVLIVDDHALIREALHAVLKQLKRETVILEASNSRQAMRLVEEHPELDLILLDVNLPDRDGFSVLGEL